MENYRELLDQWTEILYALMAVKPISRSAAHETLLAEAFTHVTDLSKIVKIIEKENG